MYHILVTYHVMTNKKNGYLTYESVMSFLCVKVYAQVDVQQSNSQTSSKLIPYRNPTLGFSIQIPSDWQIDEEIASGIVNFAGMNKSPLFIVDVKEAL
jgi:hypothetical protein